MSIILSGHSRHGKDLCALFLQYAYGITSKASSAFALETFLFPVLAEKVKTYSSLEEAYADRHNHTKIWYEEIKNYNTPRLSRLGEGILSQYDMYVGIRDHEEYTALVAHLSQSKAPVTIWIDASKRKGIPHANSMKLTKDDFEFIIDNNASREAMFSQVDSLFLALGYAPIRPLDEAIRITLEIDDNTETDIALNFTAEANRNAVEQLWERFGEVSIDNNDLTTEPFLHFDRGTDRFDVWRWFEDTFSGFSVDHTPH